MILAAGFSKLWSFSTHLAAVKDQLNKLFTDIATFWEIGNEHHPITLFMGCRKNKLVP